MQNIEKNKERKVYYYLIDFILQKNKKLNN